MYYSKITLKKFFPHKELHYETIIEITLNIKLTLAEGQWSSGKCKRHWWDLISI